MEKEVLHLQIEQKYARRWANTSPLRKSILNEFVNITYENITWLTRENWVKAGSLVIKIGSLSQLNRNLIIVSRSHLCPGQTESHKVTWFQLCSEPRMSYLRSNPRPPYYKRMSETTAPLGHQWKLIKEINKVRTLMYNCSLYSVENLVIVPGNIPILRYISGNRNVMDRIYIYKI